MQTLLDTQAHNIILSKFDTCCTFKKKKKVGPKVYSRTLAIIPPNLLTMHQNLQNGLWSLLKWQTENKIDGLIENTVPQGKNKRSCHTLQSVTFVNSFPPLLSIQHLPFTRKYTLK